LAYAQVKPKPGFLTTEFWLSVLTIVAATVMLGVSKIDSNLWMVAIGIGSGGYNISRGLAKFNPPKD